jgi:hypothetical protein
VKSRRQLKQHLLQPGIHPTLAAGNPDPPANGLSWTGFSRSVERRAPRSELSWLVGLCDAGVGDAGVRWRGLTGGRWAW